MSGLRVDIITIGAGVLSFGIFFIVHLIATRRIRPEQLLSSLYLSSALTLFCPVVLIFGLCILQVIKVAFFQCIIMALLAALIHGLLCFNYILCVFGPYETSVRMRLVREIAKCSAQGISMEELAQKYNTKIIVDIRLRRLEGTGWIIKHNDRYQIGSATNAFFIFDVVAAVLTKWIGRKDVR